MCKAGRPPNFRSPKKMWEEVEEYFQECKEREEVATITGMVYSLGFKDRNSLDYYYKEKPEFRDVINAAKLRVQAGYERALVNHKGNVTGLIFTLKNNFGWKDVQENINKDTITILPAQFEDES